MILGKIIGKTTTVNFEFLATVNAKKFEFVQILHSDYGYVLSQIIELEKDSEKTIAKCNVIGYIDENDNLKQIRMPFSPGIEVLRAEEEFIKKVINLKTKNGAYIGNLEGKNIKIYLDMNKLLTKHVSIIAKTGAGKSYCAGVLVEEIIDKGIPLLIIDPHGEYSHLKYPNDNEDEAELMKNFDIQAKGYKKIIKEYGDIELEKDAKPLKLNEKVTSADLLHLLPAKLTNSQQNILYSIIKNIEPLTISNIISELEIESSNQRIGLMNIIDYLSKLNIFSPDYTNYNELIRVNTCSIINLRGIEPEIQQIIVYKLLKDLFEERKRGNIPPFFCVIEEAHNFCPERGYNESKSSEIIKTISSEGRKFGLGLCIISQRPAIVQKTVLSQCTTQIIMKITNPNDLRAISNSIEGITTESEIEIQNLPVGTAMITGIVDMPLFVNVRPRKTKHGGRAIEIFKEQEKENDVISEIKEYHRKEILPIIKPKTTIKDIKLISGEMIKNINTILIPAVLISCEKYNNDLNLLVDLIKGHIIKNIDTKETIEIPDLNNLSINQIKLLETSLHLQSFTIEELSIKSSIDIFKTKELANSFLENNFFVINNNQKLQINSHLKVISNTSEFAFYDKITYQEIAYDKKLEKELSIEKIKNKLDKFVNIRDCKECFIVYYDTKQRFKNN
jgi:hypothetical protein